MKQAELIATLNAGAIVCVGLYWAGRLDKMSFRDKQSGNRRDGYVVRETILTDKDPIAVTRFLRDDEKPEAWKPSADKNERVVVRVTGMEMERGNIILKGAIEKLTA